MSPVSSNPIVNAKARPVLDLSQAAADVVMVLPADVAEPSHQGEWNLTLGVQALTTLPQVGHVL
jgi:hypothetical protein